MNRAYLLTAVLAVSCSPDVSPRNWDAIDAQTLEEQLDNPTLELDQAGAEALGTAFREDAPVLDDTVDYVDCSLRESTGDLEDNDPCLDGEEVAFRGLDLESTSVFARYACPGPDLERPDTAFNFGLMRVDSPGLSEEVIENFQVDGQLLLSFEPTEAGQAAGLAGCQVGRFDLAGQVPAFYSLEKEYVALNLDVETRNLQDSPDEVGRLNEVIVAGREDIALLQFTSPESFAVLRWQRTGDTDAFSVTGASQRYACTVSEMEEVDCVQMGATP